jgi:hypothetical protein
VIKLKQGDRVRVERVNPYSGKNSPTALGVVIGLTYARPTKLAFWFHGTEKRKATHKVAITCSELGEYKYSFGWLKPGALLNLPMMGWKITHVNNVEVMDDSNI